MRGAWNCHPFYRLKPRFDLQSGRIDLEYEVEWEWRWEPFADMYEADEIARPVQIPEIDVGDVEAYKFEFKKEVEQ